MDYLDGPNVIMQVLENRRGRGRKQEKDGAQWEVRGIWHNKCEKHLTCCYCLWEELCVGVTRTWQTARKWGPLSYNCLELNFANILNGPGN